MSCGGDGNCVCGDVSGVLIVWFGVMSVVMCVVVCV